MFLHTLICIVYSISSKVYITHNTANSALHCTRILGSRDPVSPLELGESSEWWLSC